MKKEKEVVQDDGIYFLFSRCLLLLLSRCYLPSVFSY